MSHEPLVEEMRVNGKQGEGDDVAGENVDRRMGAAENAGEGDKGDIDIGDDTKDKSNVLMRIQFVI